MELDLHGLGEFTEQKCGFRIYRYHLDEPWSYLYVTPNILLKLDQRGPDYIQLQPPSGIVLFRRERYQQYPPLLIWIRTENGRAFTNFWQPLVEFQNSREPEHFECEYQISSAVYRIAHDNIRVETELFVPPEESAVVLYCKITNTDTRLRQIEIVPVMRPHMAAASLAPWDVPGLYQTVAYSNEYETLFELELRSPAGMQGERRYAFVLSDIQSPDGVEVAYSRFVGKGTFENPEFTMTVPLDQRFHYGEHTPANACYGVQGIVALAKHVSLVPNQSFDITLTIGNAPSSTTGLLPSLGNIRSFSRFFKPDIRERAKEHYAKTVQKLLSARNIKTPDHAFSRYANEWLPLQLGWVHILDRGWPTGMRGSRDCAQDSTAIVPINPETARKRIIELFSVQRTDGWFPRQYSILGTHGNHDLRNYVDAGVWVWELLFDYLRWTKDFKILESTTSFLDSNRQETITNHALRIADYYLSEKNLGEHRLCLIREGDWNDSINRAGLEGRGESVMVSCQVVMMLRQMAYLLSRLGSHSELAAEYQSRADELTSHILTHAFNSEGYLNGVFTDNGEWVFSPNDPDGQRRISIPVNAWGIISGVLKDSAAHKVIDILIGLKQQDGWPLFTPPIGNPPISKLGRIGAGDLLPGLGENGTPYNHGCHGFLGRAAACVKRNDLLIEILRYMLPYDQHCHPVERAKTAPYAMVNHWKTAPGLEGRGGDPFLTGSVSTALRNIYDGLFGLKPLFDSLAIDPCLPSMWRECTITCAYMETQLEITYSQNGNGPWRIFVDGEQVEEKRPDWFGETLYVIPDSLLHNRRKASIGAIRT
ncbi:MAG: GH36-type glycosyl hydrolase domain-containing protein [Armatimonadota bacterium]